MRKLQLRRARVKSMINNILTEHVSHPGTKLFRIRSSAAEIDLAQPERNLRWGAIYIKQMTGQCQGSYYMSDHTISLKVNIYVYIYIYNTVGKSVLLGVYITFCFVIVKEGSPPQTLNKMLEFADHRF